MHETFDSDGLKLASHLARPPGFARVPGLVLCHGFPTGPRGGNSSASTYPELAERLARETGWAVLTFNFSGPRRRQRAARDRVRPGGGIGAA